MAPEQHPGEDVGEPLEDDEGLVLGKVGDEEQKEEDGEVGVRITLLLSKVCIKTQRIGPIVSLIIFVLYIVRW